MSSGELPLPSRVSARLPVSALRLRSRSTRASALRSPSGSRALLLASASAPFTPGAVPRLPSPVLALRRSLDAAADGPCRRRRPPHSCRRAPPLFPITAGSPGWFPSPPGFQSPPPNAPHARGIALLRPPARTSGGWGWPDASILLRFLRGRRFRLRGPSLPPFLRRLASFGDSGGWGCSSPRRCCCTSRSTTATSTGLALKWIDKEGKTPLMVACMRPDLLNVARCSSSSEPM
ncbi:hypothetical protein PVAP13_J127400 [Panicum virgatum]|nr:hypothetical protein PVAP13_J127400 [Panicum virgatum]